MKKAPFQILSLVTLADGRAVLIDSVPMWAGGAVGWWADVRPIDADGGYGESERASLAGARLGVGLQSAGRSGNL